VALDPVKLLKLTRKRAGGETTASSYERGPGKEELEVKVLLSESNWGKEGKASRNGDAALNPTILKGGGPTFWGDRRRRRGKSDTHNSSGVGEELFDH